MTVRSLTADHFEESVMRACVPVLLVFQVAGSEPCRGLASELEEAASKVGAGAQLYTIDANDQQELVRAFQISRIPSWMVLHNGRLVGQEIGMKSKKEILRLLAPYMK